MLRTNFLHTNLTGGVKSPCELMRLDPRRCEHCLLNNSFLPMRKLKGQCSDLIGK